MQNNAEKRWQLIRRKEREKLAKQETQVGEVKVKSELDHTLHCGEPGWPTLEEVDREIARSRQRRIKK
jgi:hypothetical protein